MKIQQDNTGLYIETDEVVCRPVESSLFKSDEEVRLALDTETATVSDANDRGADAFKEQWQAVYKSQPVRVTSAPVTHPPMYYIEHAGWYTAIIILLGVTGFDLGVLVGTIWARL
jgi:hypothetical protein